MKIYPICFALWAVFGLSQTTIGQTSDIDALTQLMGEQKVSNLQESAPGKLDLAAYVNRHGYLISNTHGQKDIAQYPNALAVEKQYPNAPELTESLLTSGNIDLLGYHFTIAKKKFNYYRIGTSGKILTILPEEISRKRMNAETN